MDRKVFLTAGLGSGLCCLMSRLGLASTALEETAAPSHSCEEKIKFAEGWIARFMSSVDSTLDEATRTKLMEANGRACAQNYIASSGTPPPVVDFEEWAKNVATRGADSGIRIEGRTIHMVWKQNYQGKDAPEGSCLCPLVESKPKGLSGTYCHCSVGYVGELFGRRFGRPVNVTLVDSVLRGGNRCQFVVEVA